MVETQKFLQICSNHEKVRKQNFHQKFDPLEPPPPKMKKKMVETQKFLQICLNHEKVGKQNFHKKFDPPHPPPQKKKVNPLTTPPFIPRHHSPQSSLVHRCLFMFLISAWIKLVSIFTIWIQMLHDFNTLAQIETKTLVSFLPIGLNRNLSDAALAQIETPPGKQAGWLGD